MLNIERRRRGTSLATRAPGRAHSADGTRESLLRSGERVFSERGYHEASVSEICRRAGLANGTFYRHFENKEEIFAALVERLQRAIRERIEQSAVQASSRRAAVTRAYRSVLSYVEEESSLYRVGRSAESMKLGIHRQFRANLADALREIIRSGIEAGEFRPVDPDTAAYALLGIIEFAVMRYVLWEPGGLVAPVLETLDSFILHGYDTGKDLTRPSKDAEQAPPPASRTDEEVPQGGGATRQALLAAAERLFGQAGFHQTSVSGITYVAGVAQGTFYLYFPSKVAVFVELAREINRQFRLDERAALAGLIDRRDVERVGFRTFFRFIDAHRGAYWVLREAELVDPETGRWYYERLAKGYMRGLRGGVERGEIRDLDVEPLAYALLGVGHSVALWGQSNGPETTLSEETIAGLLDILEHGIAAPRRQGRTRANPR
ncbi:MAG: TetR/AcrR family transcriptional regulator [Candidatus Bipolaricaulis sp.]|nr:TetR/AcrR family transcriptional regulator [Candidatus Bipolaricaulis sp.]